MLKKLLAVLLAVCMIAAFTVASGAQDAPEDDKQETETGMAGAATVAGIAVTATVGILFSIKKKK